MVHTHGHQGQEQRCAQETGQHTHGDIFGHTDGADGIDQQVGDHAGEGHDDEDVGEDAQGQNDQGRHNSVQCIRHPGADELFDFGHEQHTQDDGQHTTASGTRDGIQRIGTAGLVDPHIDQGGEEIDVGHGGDHTQHTAEDGGGAELFGGTVSGPGGDIGHECHIDHGQQLVEDEEHFQVVTAAQMGRDIGSGDESGGNIGIELGEGRA